MAMLPSQQFLLENYVRESVSEIRTYSFPRRSNARRCRRNSVHAHFEWWRGPLCLMPKNCRSPCQPHREVWCASLTRSEVLRCFPAAALRPGATERNLVSRFSDRNRPNICWATNAVRDFDDGLPETASTTCCAIKMLARYRPDHDPTIWHYL